MIANAPAATPNVVTHENLSGAGEWRKHWPVVLAAMAGLSFASIAVYSIGLFMEPLAQEFGWSRSQVTIGLSIFSLFAVPLSPVAGALIDRWGARRLAIPGILLAATAFASFGFANGSATQWVSLWVFYALVALAIKTTVWTAAVSSVFFSSRGLALAVALCGTAIAQTFAPVVAHWLIEAYGWRAAYRWMGLGWGAVVFLLLFFFFFDARDRRSTPAHPAKRSSQVTSDVPGLSLREASRNSALLKIAVAALITSVVGIGVTVHKVPILTEIGVSRQAAALMASSAGIAGICGKLFTGWLLDRSSSGWIPGISLALPSIAFALLLEPISTSSTILLAMVILGYASGASMHITAYLTTRFGGLRNFGKIFGVMASIYAFGTGVGPVLASFVYDSFGSYIPLLMGGIPAGIVCGALVAQLGPYPVWARETALPAVRT